MLKIEMNQEKNIIHAEVGGTIEDLVSESLATVNLIYEAIKEQSEGGAVMYKKYITDDISMSFMDEDERNEYMKNKEERSLNELRKNLSDIRGLLKSLLEVDDDDDFHLKS